MSGSSSVPDASSPAFARVAVKGPIALVGDSILGMSSEQSLKALRDAGWGFITLNAKASRTIPVDSVHSPELSGILAIRHIRATGADPVTWVVELGTNDIGNTGNDGTAMSKLIDKMLGEIGPGHRILWMNVRQGNELAASATFDAALDMIASTRTDLTVGDWASIAATPGYLNSDHVHPSPVGQQAYADLLASAAERLAALPMPEASTPRRTRSTTTTTTMPHPSRANASS